MTVKTVIGMLALGLLAACQSTGTSRLAPAQLPENLAMTAPAQSVPSEMARFAGVWFGTWGSTLDGKLAVQSVGADGRIVAIYAWGDHARGRFKAGSTNVTGRIENGQLRLKQFENGARVTYRFLDDGALRGEYDLNGEISVGRFTRREAG